MDLNSTQHKIRGPKDPSAMSTEQIPFIGRFRTMYSFFTSLNLQTGLCPFWVIPTQPTDGTSSPYYGNPTTELISHLDPINDPS